MIDDRNILDSFTLDFCNVVEKYCKYIIVSGFFAIVTGRSRGTEDIDILIENISFEVFQKIHTELLINFELLTSIENIEELYYEYIEKKVPIRYIKKGELFPNMELKMCKNELELNAILNRKKYNKIPLEIYLPDFHQQIAFKETVLTSQKDIEDAKHLRIFFSDELEESKIEHYKKLCKEVYRL